MKRKYENMGNNYANSVRSAIAVNPTFKAICEFNIQQFPADGYSKYYNSLQKGTVIPNTHELCNAYLVCYGDKHYLKMYKCFSKLFSSIQGNNAICEIFDWGCGQALATGVLLDYIENNCIQHTVSNITLIDPSKPNIERGLIHIGSLLNAKEKSTKLTALEKKCEEVRKEDIYSNKETVKIHLFSNILDMNINRKYISELIKSNCKGINYFVCVSPYGFPKLVEFENYFTGCERISMNTNSFVGEIYQASSRSVISDTIYRHELIFKTNL